MRPAQSLVARCRGIFTVFLGKYLVGGVGLDERRTAGVPSVDEGADLGFQLRDGAAKSTVDGLPFLFRTNTSTSLIHDAGAGGEMP